MHSNTMICDSCGHEITAGASEDAPILCPNCEQELVVQASLAVPPQLPSPADSPPPFVDVTLAHAQANTTDRFSKISAEINRDPRKKSDDIALAMLNLGYAGMMMLGVIYVAGGAAVSGPPILAPAIVAIVLYLVCGFGLVGGEKWGRVLAFFIAGWHLIQVAYVYSQVTRIRNDYTRMIWWTVVAILAFYVGIVVVLALRKRHRPAGDRQTAFRAPTASLRCTKVLERQRMTAWSWPEEMVPRTVLSDEFGRRLRLSQELLPGVLSPRASA